MKTILIIFLGCGFLALSSFAQDQPTQESPFHLQAGLTYNQSAGIENPTGVGLYLQALYLPTSRLRLGLRLEPTLLAEGEFVQESDPPIRGGSNYLVNNYLSADFLLGQPRFTAEGKARARFYLTTQAIMATHRVFIGVGDQRERESHFGAGIGVGCDIGRWDLGTSMNFMAGDALSNYVSLNVGYTFWK
ncbi:MAG: hypothetical protein AAGA85_19030 [Bacteroidota bacterium]